MSVPQLMAFTTRNTDPIKIALISDYISGSIQLVCFTRKSACSLHSFMLLIKEFSCQKDYILSYIPQEKN